METLKDKQKEAICSFVNGRDFFVILPTGYGKTLCYVLLPYVFDHLRGITRSSIVICVSPLISLMMDQVRKVFTTRPGNTICWSSSRGSFCNPWSAAWRLSVSFYES